MANQKHGRRIEMRRMRRIGEIKRMRRTGRIRGMSWMNWILSIGSVSSKRCKNKHGTDGQAIVNQDGAELSFAWFCSNQGTTTIVGTPTFVPEEGDGPCAHQHQVGDQGN